MTHNKNPFEDENPFADESVRNARSSSVVKNEAEYNPFANDQFSKQPAVIQAIPETVTPGPNEEYRRQLEELDRKAAELQKREQELNRNTFSNEGMNINNFPPLPACCPLKPCFHIDFNTDIPPQFQRVVKYHFYLWMEFSLLLLLNVAAALAFFIVTPSKDNGGTTFGLSIVYFLLFIPLSFLCWFRPVYKAFSGDRSIDFFIYFFIHFLHCCMCIVFSIGILGSGAVGFISGLSTLNANVGVGVFMIIIGVIFGVNAAIGFILIMRVLHLFRSNGASFEKAQAELAQGVVSNSAVQQAAGNVIRSSFNSSDNRY